MKVISHQPNGQLIREYEYHAIYINRLHGPYTKWHSNGQIEYSMVYIIGLIEGVVLMYGFCGERQVIGNYKKHIKHGPQINFKYQ